MGLLARWILVAIVIVSMNARAGSVSVYSRNPDGWTPFALGNGSAMITDRHTRSGNGSLEIREPRSGDSASFFRHSTDPQGYGLLGNLLSNLNVLSFEWFISPDSNPAAVASPYISLRIYNFGDPRTFFLVYQPCRANCTVNEWQFANAVGQLEIRKAEAGTVPPSSLAQIPGDAFVADLTVGGYTPEPAGPLNLAADNVTIGMKGQDPTTFNFEFGFGPEFQLTQTGFRFQAVVGGGVTPPRSFEIVNRSPVRMAFAVSATTLSGGAGWLNATGTGFIEPGSVGPSPPVQIKVAPAGLAPGDYYGQVKVDSPQAINSPLFLSIVLTVYSTDVDPGPFVEPTGVSILRDKARSTTVASSTVQITNLASQAISFTSDPNPLLVVSPPAAEVRPGQTVAVAVLPSSQFPNTPSTSTTLALDFSPRDSRRLVNIQVFTTGLAAAAKLASAPCTPTKLVPIFTALGANFNTNAAYPTPVEVLVQDDCGASMDSGSVAVVFSNNDPQLDLVHSQNGRWSGTWVPMNARPASMTITADANQPVPPLDGKAQIAGTLLGNSDAPVLAPGGMVSAAGYNGPPSPGEIAAVFGSKLTSAQGANTSLPLGTTLSDTTLILAGRLVPILFTRDDQANIVIPYDVPAGNSLQLIARRGDRISAPLPVRIAPANPAVFTIDASGKGQGHIYVAANGVQTLANASAPAGRKEVVVIYCTGLGATNPPATAGAATPLAPLTYAIAPATVTIGGFTATVDFQGLTPLFTGLYQINAVVPDRAPSGDNIPVVVTVGDSSGPPVSMAIR
jgi:uncharacterized protein (TIGR03437 family)